MMYFIGCLSLLLLTIVLGVRRAWLMDQRELRVWLVVFLSLSVITFAAFGLMIIDLIQR